MLILNFETFCVSIDTTFFYLTVLSLLDFCYATQLMCQLSPAGYKIRDVSSHNAN